MKRYLLVYHKEDNDGVFSAAIFYNYLVHDLNIDSSHIEPFGADYNILSQYSASHDTKSLKEQYDSIIVTDISFSKTYMKELYKTFGNDFIWCDHHKPIIDESYKLHFDSCPGVRNTQKSAILCVYEFLYDQFNEIYSTIEKQADPRFPELFRVLSGWDSWSYEHEGYDFDYVRNVNKGVTTTFKLSFEKVVAKVSEMLYYYHKSYDNEYEHDWNQIKEEEFINKMHNIGKVLNEYDDNVMADIIRNSGDTSWKVLLPNSIVHPACAIFHQGATNSTMFKSLKNTGLWNGIVFKHSKDGNWIMSLYNINDDCNFHCGEFLKEKYGGGGHKGAAGCTLTERQFINILKKKTI